MPDKRYSKVEEEIIQILDRLEDERPARPARQRGHLKLVKPPRQRKRLDLGRLMPATPLLPLLAAFVLAFLAITFRETSWLATILAVASILAFLAPIVMRRGMSADGGFPSETKQWRGRDISFSPPSGPSPLDRARRWMGGRRRPRL
jgi:hypothetical protein